MSEPGQATVTDDEVRRWLDEDVGPGDLTSVAIVPEHARCSASMSFKEPGVVAGLEAVHAVFLALDPNLAWVPLHRDGELIAPSEVVRIDGLARALLSGERLALNLLGRLSGVATLTRGFVDAVAGTGVTILDTRKTTPGLRVLEKAAVRAGGGTNHRQGLYDAILIKDNHLLFARSLGEAVARSRGAGVPVVVECDTVEQVREALEARPDRILLDNMTVEQLAESVSLVAHRVPLEASGGVTLANVRAIAETGVEFVSSGALTNSAGSLNVSMEVVRAS